jgi:hypothetical protein
MTAGHGFFFVKVPFNFEFWHLQKFFFIRISTTVTYKYINQRRICLHFFSTKSHSQPQNADSTFL